MHKERPSVIPTVQVQGGSLGIVPGRPVCGSRKVFIGSQEGLYVIPRSLCDPKKVFMWFQEGLSVVPRRSLCGTTLLMWSHEEGSREVFMRLQDFDDSRAPSL